MKKNRSEFICFNLWIFVLWTKVMLKYKINNVTVLENVIFEDGFKLK
jgi:hypothetical protein